MRLEVMSDSVMPGVEQEVNLSLSAWEGEATEDSILDSVVSLGSVPLNRSNWFS